MLCLLGRNSCATICLEADFQTSGSENPRRIGSEGIKYDRPVDLHIFTTGDVSWTTIDVITSSDISGKLSLIDLFFYHTLNTI